MPGIAFDTLTAAKNLQAAGVPDEQAEAIVRVVSQSQDTLAMKSDLETMEARLKYDLTIRVGVMLAAGFGITIGIMML